MNIHSLACPVGLKQIVKQESSASSIALVKRTQYESLSPVAKLPHVSPLNGGVSSGH
jgi:hypothetical protein